MGTQNDPPLMPSAVQGLERAGGPIVSTASDEALRKALDALNALRPKVEKFCKDRPVTAIAIGVLVGVGLRKLLSRR